MAKQLNAVRLNSQELQALKYVHKRIVLALRRRGLSVASKHEVEKSNSLHVLIDKISGQKRLF